VKIDKSSNPMPLVPSNDAKARATVAKQAENPAAPKTPSSTSVNIGTTSAQLRTMESGMANTSLVNSAKVAEIKQAISEGRFQVNAGAVADSLIKSVNDLISSQA